MKLLLCHDLETSTFQLKLKTSLYTLVASLLLACTGRASEIYEMLLRCTKQHTFLVQKQYNSYACDLSVLGVRMATNKSEGSSECEGKRITALLLIGLNIHCYRHFNDTTANVRLCASSANGLTVTFPPLFFEAVLSQCKR